MSAKKQMSYYVNLSNEKESKSSNISFYPPYFIYSSYKYQYLYFLFTQNFTKISFRKIHIIIIYEDSHFFSNFLVDDSLLSFWEKLSDKPEWELEGPQELVDKVSDEDDGDTEHGTVSGHDAVWGDGA